MRVILSDIFLMHVRKSKIKIETHFKKNSELDMISENIIVQLKIMMVRL